MDEGRYLIGVDIGTTSIKGGLFDFTGMPIAHHSVAYPTARPDPQRVEQDPCDWTRAIDAILAIVLNDVPVCAVAAIGLCGQVNTHIFVDGTGNPLMPAIVWQDGRAASIAAELDARVTPERKRGWWGADFPIGATSALSRMAWVARHRPELWERTAAVLSPKDYCLLKLTGTLTTDPVSAFDLVDSDGRYIDDLLALVPGAAGRVPPLRAVDAVIGAATGPFFADRRPPVVNGTMDGWACLPGVGASGPGQGAYISGTSEIVALISDRRIGAPGIVSFPPIDGWRVHAGPTQSGGDSLRWLAAASSRSIDQSLKEAEAADRRRSSVIFLPHLEGERAPLWDPYSRGAFVGMQSSSGFPELAAAVLEGVAFSARLLLEAASTAAGMNYPSLFLGGGGARSDLWCQIRADILGIELQRGEFLDSGVLGAAIIAAVGIGIFPSLSAAAGAMRRPSRSFAPDRGLGPRYDDLFQLYRDTYWALGPVNKGLAAMTGARSITSPAARM